MAAECRDYNGKRRLRRAIPTLDFRMALPRLGALGKLGTGAIQA